MIEKHQSGRAQCENNTSTIEFHPYFDLFFFVLIAPAAHGVHIFLPDVSGFDKGTRTLASLSKTSEFSLKLRICFSSHIKKSILKDSNYFFQVLPTSKGSVVRQRAHIK